MNKKTHLEPVALLLLTAFQHMALAVADVVFSNISQYNADDNLNKKKGFVLVQKVRWLLIHVLNPCMDWVSRIKQRILTIDSKLLLLDSSEIQLCAFSNQLL